MFAIVCLVALVASASAFAPAARMASSSALRMSAEGMVGQLSPIGFFDPLGLSEGKNMGELKKIREAELKHGRVAMLASLGFIIGETVDGQTPLLGGLVTGPAIYQFQQADDDISFFWVGVLFLVALVEGQNILSGWESTGETAARKGGVAELKADYINGDLGFDPLNFTPTNQADFDTMRTKELQNGRLAMIGIAGMVAQELVTGNKIF